MVCLLSFIFALPNAFSAQFAQSLPSWLPHRQLNLGIDLRGGARVVLEPEIAQALRAELQAMGDRVRRELRGAERPIAAAAPAVRGQTVEIRLIEPADLAAARDIARKTLRALERDAGARDAAYELTAVGNSIVLTMTEAGLAAFKDRLFAALLKIVLLRLDRDGTGDVSAYRQGTRAIVVEIPGARDMASIEARLAPAKMDFHLLHPSLDADARTVAPPGYVPVASGAGDGRWYLLENSGAAGLAPHRRAPGLSGRARRRRIPVRCGGRADILRADAREYRQAFAVKLDDAVISARIQSEICGGRGVIQGNFSVKAALDLAASLEAGALPARLATAQSTFIGPALGADSIEAGLWACALGVALIFVFLIASYGVFGVFAALSLLVNLAIVAAAMSLLQATLTLPGIAGIVLSLGMSVDANVLIYERMREEARAGRAPLAAMEAGFARAFTAMANSNATSIIAGLLLFAFGSGAVKGFGVTLVIGVAASFFTAIMLTRLQLAWWWRRRRPRSLPIA